MPDRLLSLAEVDYLQWLTERMPCPVCQKPMQQITAIRPGYTEMRWACPSCQFNLNRGPE